MASAVKAAAEKSSADPSATLPQEKSQPTVVLVEDEVLIRELIEEALLDAGLAVTSAANGAAAIHAVGHGEHDILVTDINLGLGPDGFEVAREARRLRPGVKIV